MGRELVNGCVYRSYEEARQAIFEYVKVSDNRKRWHSSLEYVMPLRLNARLPLLNFSDTKPSQSHHPFFQALFFHLPLLR